MPDRTISELLTSLDVYTGHPGMRDALATKLEKQGFSADDSDVIYYYVTEMDKRGAIRNAGAFATDILRSVERWKDVVKVTRPKYKDAVQPRGTNLHYEAPEEHNG